MIKMEIPRSSLISRCIAVSLFITLISCTNPSIPINSSGDAQCKWLSTVVAWQDNNRDKEHQDNEPILEGVTIIVEGHSLVNNREVTDERGIAQIEVFF